MAPSGKKWGKVALPARRPSILTVGKAEPNQALTSDLREVPVATGSGERGTGSANGDGASRAPVFLGVTQLSLDAKGRLAVPARHRDVLLAGGNGGLVLTADPSRCLLVYPVEAWEPIQARLKSSPYIASAVLFGDRQPQVVALIVPMTILGRWSYST